VKIVLILSFVLSLWAKQDLSPLEKKLYKFIQNTQYKEHYIKRYIGTWPTYPKYSGARKEIPESNSFMTLQTIVLLNAVDKDYNLENVEDIYTLADNQIQNYVLDAKQTNEIEGTISFWPLLQADNGKWIRSFDTQWYNTSMRILNVGNDFDSSSQAFSWFYKRKTNKEFLNNFVKNVSSFVDANRSLEHPANKKWKSKNSGAFLTWAETEAPEKPVNRIMDLVNDVDCVVNLNILTALSSYENNIAELPQKTIDAKINSCKLIHKVLLENKEGQCATWYTRKSHFYLAFSKAYEADTFCLQEDKDLVYKRAKIRAKYLLEHKNMKAYTEISELLIVLKSLKKKRTFFFNKMIIALENELKKGIVQREKYAYLPSKHSLFGGQAFSVFHFDWYGRANATALALRALSMK